MFVLLLVILRNGECSIQGKITFMIHRNWGGRQYGKQGRKACGTDTAMDFEWEKLS